MPSTPPSYGAILPLSPLNKGGNDLIEESQIPERISSNKPRFRCASVVTAVALASIGGIIMVKHSCIRPNHVQSNVGSLSTFSDPKIVLASLPMPDGVNIGSWLSLEDYFFAGQSAVEVATPDDATAAVCLPPLHIGSSTGPTWHAETDLLQNLAADTTLGHAIRVFHAHRNSFLDFEEDLEVLTQLGIRSIRVPISWCLTDEDPSTIDPKDSDIRTLEERFTCQDPFFDGVLWPASKS